MLWIRISISSKILLCLLAFFKFEKKCNLLMSNVKQFNVCKLRNVAITRIFFLAVQKIAVMYLLLQYFNCPNKDGNWECWCCRHSCGTYLHKRYEIALLGVFPIKEIIQNISMRLQELLNPPPHHHPVLHLICQTPLS